MYKVLVLKILLRKKKIGLIKQVLKNIKVYIFKKEINNQINFL
jgi:hypothetical protein